MEFFNEAVNVLRTLANALTGKQGNNEISGRKERKAVMPVQSRALMCQKQRKHIRPPIRAEPAGAFHQPKAQAQT